MVLPNALLPVMLPTRQFGNFDKTFHTQPEILLETLPTFLKRYPGSRGTPLPKSYHPGIR